MRLIFLGTGGSLPTPKRNVSAIAVHMGSELLLFDCGEGTQRQFMLSSASFMKVTSIFITHLHGDHFLGLPAMIQSMSFSGRTRPLYVHGPEGMEEAMRSMLALGYFKPSFHVMTMEVEEGDEIEFPGFKVMPIEADHTVPAFAYVIQEDPRPGKFNLDKAKGLGLPEGPLFSRLQGGEAVEVGGRTITPDMVLGPKRRGRKVLISGDTRPSKEIIEAGNGADLIVHEATLHSSLGQEAAEYGHSTAAEAAEVAKQAGAKLLCLYHFSNRYDDAQVLLDEARAIFPNTILAEDLSSLQVNPPEEEWNRQAKG
ncbi:MAG: ribonuclease Z [Methanomassiliicoccales archaeon]|nr:ribonuclease Z [Methanomassiliicoccales archaeon]MDD1756164.1 ribonuclease Z [Methanomassiliicoccales archaeon]